MPIDSLWLSIISEQQQITSTENVEMNAIRIRMTQLVVLTSDKMKNECFRRWTEIQPALIYRIVWESSLECQSDMVGTRF